MRTKEMIKAIDYGKSMYGGWYVNFIKNSIMDGLHADSYKELKRRCKLCNISMDEAIRKDN